MTNEIDIPAPSGWEELGRRESAIYWMKIINSNVLRIEYSKDEITGEWVTKGVVLSIYPARHWLIKDGRKYEWIFQTKDGEPRIQGGDFVATDLGAGEVIDDDVSTPKKIAAYLEMRLAS